MSFFGVAEAAVSAALEAGARYADARVMHRRYESMTARNGEVEELNSDESAGLGVRALVGSSWGFFGVPDNTESAARSAGRRATAIAKASATVPGPGLDLISTPAAVASWANDCAIDPWASPCRTKATC
jgi:TldD protein